MLAVKQVSEQHLVPDQGLEIKQQISIHNKSVLYQSLQIKTTDLCTQQVYTVSGPTDKQQISVHNKYVLYQGLQIKQQI
jgi:hypothetical protein